MAVPHTAIGHTAIGPGPVPATVSGNRIAIVAAAAFLPILAISFLGWWDADTLSALVSIAPTNLLASQAMLAGFLHPAVQGDSWLPMYHALEILHGAGRDRLYEILFFRDHVRFQYPPSSLLALDILSAAGISGARALNAINSLVFLLNAAALGFLAVSLFRPVGRTSRFGAAAGIAALAASAAFLFYPLVRAYLLGQIQLWIDLSFTLAIICWLFRRKALAGVFIGLACTIKPQIGLLLLWGLVWRERRFAAGAAAAFIPLLLLSLFRYGIHNHIAYLSTLSFLSRHGEAYFANNSVNGILNWHLSPYDSLHWHDGSFVPYNAVVHAGTLAASILALALIVVPPLLRKRPAGLADLSAAAICTVVGSPVAWEHHYGILLPLYLVALNAVFARPPGPARMAASGTLVLSWILVADFIPFTSLLAGTPFAIAQAYCFMGALLLLNFFLAIPRPAFVLSHLRNDGYRAAV
jgi:hypothetical protein